MNKRIAKKKAKNILKQERPLISAKEIKAISKARLIESLRTPEKYEGKLKEKGDYYTAIKKYHDYLNKGLIRESSILDKYESADAFVSTLSQADVNKLLKEGERKEAQIQQHAAAREQSRWDQYKGIDF